jgi:hypothetical protein
MSKYISQVNNTNFVYPNYELAEYDVEIIHNINTNTVSGILTGLTTTSIASTGITFNWGGIWYKNGADVFVRSTGVATISTLHLMVQGQTYYSPWRIVDSNSASVSSTTVGFNRSFTITPSQMGVTSFTTGTYYFEVRFVGGKSVYPICQTLSITVP